MSKIDDIKNHYLPRLKRKKHNFDILDWASAESQAARFDVLRRFVKLEGRTLLDVGCGLGDLATFLDRNGVRLGRYVGVDVIPEMLEMARKLRPALEFVRADVFSSQPAESLVTLGSPDGFDVVFCSGTLNLNLGNNDEFIERAVVSMLGLAREYLVFNCLHSRFPFADKKYFSYNPEYVLGIVHKYLPPKKVKFVDDYLAGDFTVICQQDST